MFSKTSRYRWLPDLVTLDARGTSAASKALRLLPPVTGTFFHTVEEADRLDHLAYKYYQQSTLWWRICDANAEIVSPRQLLGKEPVVTFRFPLGTGGADERPPWSELLRRLRGLVGIEDAAFEEKPERALTVRFNRLSVTLEDVAAEIESVLAPAGLAGQPTAIGRVGKRIAIPPRPVGGRS